MSETTLLTRKEAMDWLRIGHSTWNRYKNQGLLPIVKIGGRPLIIKEELEKRMRRQLGNA